MTGVSNCWEGRHESTISIFVTFTKFLSGRGIESWGKVVVVVVVDSRTRGIVLATGKTTVTHKVSHRPNKRQLRSWSQRGTKVDGSHHGDSPLLRPTVGIQIAIRSYAPLQAWHRPMSKRFINFLTPYREQPRSTRIVAAYPRLAFSATMRTNNARISFNQRDQVSQGQPSYRNKGN